MLPDRVSNPGPLTYESGALPIALRGPAKVELIIDHPPKIGLSADTDGLHAHSSQIMQISLFEGCKGGLLLSGRKYGCWPDCVCAQAGQHAQFA